MGEFAQYTINGNVFYCRKNEAAAFPTCMEAFAPDEWECIGADEPNGPVYRFRTTADKARARLDVLGFTFDKADSLLRSRIDRFEKSGRLYEDFVFVDTDSSFYWSDDEVIDDRARALVDDLIAPGELARAYRQYYGRKIHDGFAEQIAPANSLVKHMLDNHQGFLLDIDPLFELRLILDSIDGNPTIAYDCSAVIGYWDYGVKNQLMSFLAEWLFSSLKSALVVTEGKTDDEFIRGAIELIRPEVSHLFRFFDYYSDGHPQRSADSVTKLANAFAASRLIGPCIFVYDNDAAGHHAFTKLTSALPKNMAAITLPDIGLSKQYPTLGPNGVTIGDVSRRACAIEFYCGTDCLKLDDGSFRQIEWKSREGGEYQGGFSNGDKTAIQESFRAALKEAKEVGIENSEHDWEPMRAVVEAIVSASSEIERR